MPPDGGDGRPARAQPKWGRLISAAASLTASLAVSYLSELSETRSEHIFIIPPLPPDHQLVRPVAHEFFVGIYATPALSRPDIVADDSPMTCLTSQ